MSRHQISNRLPPSAHGYRTVVDAGRGLGLENDKLPTGMPQYFAIKLHHAMTGMQIPGALQRTECVDLCNNSVR